MADSLWQTVLGEIELAVSEATFKTWFKPTKLLSVKNGDVVVGVNNIFVKQQFEDRFAQQLKTFLEKNQVTVNSISFKIIKSGEDAETLDSVVTPTAKTIQPPVSPASHSSSSSSGSQSTFNEKYTFDNFIVGASNDLAYAACQAITKNPGQKYNPLFLYGQAGLGKTHLIQAVGNEIAKRTPESAVLYITCETFVQEFLDSIRYKKKDFATKYRNADVLIVDDIQFIAGKEKTEEAFFHTFNALHQSNKQIILTSDQPPKSIPVLAERLRSRFEWGMAVDIQPLDFETRCAILQSKASEHNVVVPGETVEYLAKHIQTNIRELEGQLNQVLAFCDLRGLSPTLDVVSSLIGGNKQSPKRLTPKSIVEKTARYFHVGMEDLLSPKRDKDIVFPRQVAMYLLRSELHLSFPKVATALGRKDHTTAIHSVDKISKSMNLDQEVKQSVNDIKERLYA